MKKILCLMFLILICGCSNNEVDKNGVSVLMIGTEAVYSEINNDNVYIVDVREEHEYNSGHIQNAHNIPLSEIDTINKKIISLDSKIIVYCHSGNRSNKAAEMLLEMGYTNVYDMGGINSWQYELVKK